MTVTCHDTAGHVLQPPLARSRTRLAAQVARDHDLTGGR